MADKRKMTGSWRGAALPQIAALHDIKRWTAPAGRNRKIGIPESCRLRMPITDTARQIKLRPLHIIRTVVLLLPPRRGGSRKILARSQAWVDGPDSVSHRSAPSEIRSPRTGLRSLPVARRRCARPAQKRPPPAAGFHVLSSGSLSARGTNCSATPLLQ